MVLLIALLFPPAVAEVSDGELEQRARKLGESLRCVVCKGESVRDSNSELAADMRRLIRQKLGRGESDEEIIEWLRSRYGDYIMDKPPLTTRTYGLWFLPLLFLLLGWRLFRRLL